MTNQEKIAGIRQRNEQHKKLRNSGNLYAIFELKHIDDKVTSDIDFLLSELELKESEYQATLDKCNNGTQLAVEEENHKLRDELDGWKDHRSELVIKNTELFGRLQSARQDLKVANDTNKRLNDKNLALVKREQKLIEGLRFYADERRYQTSWYAPAGAYTEKAQKMLKELGVME